MVQPSASGGLSLECPSAGQRATFAWKMGETGVDPFLFADTFQRWTPSDWMEIPFSFQVRDALAVVARELFNKVTIAVSQSNLPLLRQMNGVIQGF